MSVMGGASSRTILRRLLTNLKLVYLKRGEYAQALAAVERLLLLHPDAPEDLRDLGVATGNLGHFEEGIQTLERYLEQLPNATDRAFVEEQIKGFRYWSSRRN